jgi:hypothetical protein
VERHKVQTLQPELQIPAQDQDEGGSGYAPKNRTENDHGWPGGTSGEQPNPNGQRECEDQCEKPIHQHSEGKELRMGKRTQVHPVAINLMEEVKREDHTNNHGGQ